MFLARAVNSFGGKDSVTSIKGERPESLLSSVSNL